MKHLPKFRKQFKIDPKADLREVAVAVEAIYEAHEISTNFLGAIDPPNCSEGFRIHSLVNLLGRIFEHSQAMLVAIATGSPASAEALARIVIEGSINVMYLAVRGDTGTLINFFESWLTEHDLKLTKWKEKIQGEDYADKVSLMIEERRGVVIGLENYLRHMEVNCSIDKTTKEAEWPKSLFKRFEALHRETDYYESYHRLSGASHITGEDTLTWLFSLKFSDVQQHQMAVEAWAYSIMMTRIASRFFVEAAASCVIAYGRRENEDLQNSRQSLGEAVVTIAKKAGVPVDAQR
ncbi:Uncharacterised protein [Comamonas aquatica]|nr:DUF5677 domain-containing protein [Comamonas aquatica]CAB5695395.1 Uncharacterised protein [Comamonas aquatica]CAC9218113.1 Uncharacterised protein [Comamonas aquatica]